ncbi:uncharacterized protein LOC135804978 [Sycon ciliatum]|uniref:uncharacterized protein LOC135804978 n=1 Tax=Sycon ciliatum TaxID=27933 RepID=UPI0031F6A097
MASSIAEPRLPGQQAKKKRKRVSAKFRRLTKERRQANARERDRADSLRRAFLSLEGSLPHNLKEQLPTRFGTMLAAILYIGHLTELVCGRESPALEVANRATCRRYQGLTGNDGEAGEEESDALVAEDDHRQIELSLDVGELLIQPASKPTGCANGGPVPCTAESLTPQSPLLSTSSPFSQSSSPSPDASTSSNCSRSGSSGGGSSNSDSLSDLDLLSSSSHTSLLAAAESLEHGMCGGGSVDLFSGSLFSMPDLGTDDIFADLFDNNVHRFLPPGPVLS